MAKANQVSRKVLDREINDMKQFDVSKNISVKTFMIRNDPFVILFVLNYQSGLRFELGNKLLL